MFLLCFKNLNYLSIGKNAPIINTDALMTIYFQLLPSSIETIVASYFGDDISLTPSSPCTFKQQRRRFDDWTTTVPKLPEPQNYSTEIFTYDFAHLLKRYPKAFNMSVPKHVKYVYADNIKFQMNWLSGEKDYTLLFNPDND